jgi:hypothetical protein
MRKFIPVLFSSALFATSLATISFTVASADETPSATPVPMATTSTPPAIKNANGTYSVGDVGPGGGFIFYINVNGFKCGPKFTSNGSPTGGLCHYLEVAPSGWRNGKPGSEDPWMPWSVKAQYYKNVLGLDNFEWPPKPEIWEPVYIIKSGIGSGYKNSIAIVNQGNDATSAAGAARAYKGGSLNDWYLPTLGELNNLSKWARGLPWKSESATARGGTMNSPIFGAGTVGLVVDPYWSSNEGIRETVDKAHHVVGNPKYAASFAYYHVNSTEENIRISPHILGPGEKITLNYVRPIRAF